MFRPGLNGRVLGAFESELVRGCFSGDISARVVCVWTGFPLLVEMVGLWSVTRSASAGSSSIFANSLLGFVCGIGDSIFGLEVCCGENLLRSTSA